MNKKKAYGEQCKILSWCRVGDKGDAGYRKLVSQVSPHKLAPIKGSAENGDR